MESVLSPPRPTRSRPDSRILVLAGAALAVVLFGVLLLEQAAEGPGFVPRIVVDNPGLFDLEVSVSGDGPALPLGTASRESVTTFSSVLDQGATWTFSFTYGGAEGGSVAVERAALEAAGWKITVPADVGATLAGAGLSPTGA